MNIAGDKRQTGLDQNPHRVLCTRPTLYRIVIHSSFVAPNSLTMKTEKFLKTFYKLGGSPDFATNQQDVETLEGQKPIQFPIINMEAVFKVHLNTSTWSPL